MISLPMVFEGHARGLARRDEVCVVLSDGLVEFLGDDELDAEPPHVWSFATSVTTHCFTGAFHCSLNLSSSVTSFFYLLSSLSNQPAEGGREGEEEAPLTPRWCSRR
jgi:hypothetical protein